MLVKKMYLKLIYTCIVYSGYRNAKSLAESVLDELFQTVDKSQLSINEIKQIPADYIRQVCNLAPNESDDQVETQDQEREMYALINQYLTYQRRRYSQLMSLYAQQVAAERNQFIVAYKHKKMKREARE